MHPFDGAGIAGMSYTAVLADCCPPGCWHHAIPRGGQAMRWTSDEPILRFLSDGLHIAGGDACLFDDPNIVRGVE